MPGMLAKAAEAALLVRRRLALIHMAIAKNIIESPTVSPPKSGQ